MRCLHAISTALGPQRVAVVWFAALAVVAAGCGGAIPSSNGGPAGVKLDHSKLGQYLVDSEGHTLYLFERDEKGEDVNQFGASWYVVGAKGQPVEPKEASGGSKGGTNNGGSGY